MGRYYSQEGVSFRISSKVVFFLTQANGREYLLSGSICAQICLLIGNKCPFSLPSLDALSHSDSIEQEKGFLSTYYEQKHSPSGIPLFPVLISFFSPSIFLPAFICYLAKNGPSLHLSVGCLPQSTCRWPHSTPLRTLEFNRQKTNDHWEHLVFHSSLPIPFLVRYYTKRDTSVQKRICLGKQLLYTALQYLVFLLAKWSIATPMYEWKI